MKLIQDPGKLLQTRILEHFSMKRMTSDTRNHVVPLFDFFPDSYDPNLQFMVMPVLRRFDDPEFVAPCEVIDFISQALEVCDISLFNRPAQPPVNGAPVLMLILVIGIVVYAREFDSSSVCPVHPTLIVKC